MIRRLTRDDLGQSLIFVMFIGIFTMLLVGTTTTAVITQIKPARISQDDAAALAAAEAGIEDFVGWVNKNCPPTQGFACAALTTPQAATRAVTGADSAGTSGSFAWSVLYTVPGVARVRSVGTSHQSHKTLVADINATPSFNNFEYYTKYETYSSDLVNDFYGPRSIQVTDPTGSTLVGAGVLHWAGVCSYVDAATTPTCNPVHSSDICDDFYYGSGSTGRGTATAWSNTLGRRPGLLTQTALGTDNSFAYYAENGTYNGTGYTHNDTCDTSFEPNMVMNGPVYSEDAYLVDRGDNTGSSKNSTPIFNSYAYSLWDGSTDGATAQPGPNGGYVRIYPGTDGRIDTTIAPTPVYTTNKLDLPANADAAKTLASCIYTGPTRIRVVQNIAYVTSPGTPAGEAPCYQSTGDFAGAGVVNAAVPINSSLIYVQNPDTDVHAPATAANPIFDLKTALTTPANSSTSSLTGTWNDDAAYSPTAACPTPADPAKRRNLDCETGKSTPREDVMSAIQSAVNAVAAGAAPDSALQLSLSTAITGKLSPTVVAAGAPNSLIAGQVRYVVTVGTPSPAGLTIKPATQTDRFFQSTAGAGYTRTVTTWPVAITRYSCASGTCNKPTATEMLTPSSAVTRTTYTATATVNSTSKWPWFGSTTSYTDADNDITQHKTGYGDVYIEGTLKGNLTMVAEHDIVVTNNTVYSNTDVNTTTDGLALIADHNVRVYRPMTCTDNGTAGLTSPGWCPNDLTGVYPKPLQWPPSKIPNYPVGKYVLDTAPSLPNTASSTNSDGQLYATIFTLRGSFVVDNFYRGELGTGLTLHGGLYQYHRGPTSLPYQGRPYQGSTTKMPGMTMTYNYDNMRSGQGLNGGLRVPWLPPPSGSTSTRTWNVVAMSTGA